MKKLLFTTALIGGLIGGATAPASATMYSDYGSARVSCSDGFCNYSGPFGWVLELLGALPTLLSGSAGGSSE